MAGVIMNEKRYPRGSNPPYLSLADALALTQKVYEQGGGHASDDLLSKITGNSSSSSSFIKKVNTLKTYGLASESVKGRLELSELGNRIVAPKNPEEAAFGKLECFLKIDVFERVYDRHKGKLLPADEFIRNIIEQDCRKPRGLLDSWVAAFKDAAKTVGILHNRGDGKIQIMESASPFPAPMITQEGTSVAVEKTAPGVRQAESSEQLVATTTVPFSASGHNTKIEISGGRFSVFSIPDRLTKRDAQKLKGALTGLSQIIDSMVEESEVP